MSKLVKCLCEEEASEHKEPVKDALEKDVSGKTTASTKVGMTRACLKG